jgi:hypothetical protein
LSVFDGLLQAAVHGMSGARLLQKNGIGLLQLLKLTLEGRTVIGESDVMNQKLREERRELRKRNAMNGLDDGLLAGVR